jgi:hypothetical protein
MGQARAEGGGDEQILKRRRQPLTAEDEPRALLLNRLEETRPRCPS